MVFDALRKSERDPGGFVPGQYRKPGSAALGEAVPGYDALPETRNGSEPLSLLAGTGNLAVLHLVELSRAVVIDATMEG